MARLAISHLTFMHDQEDHGVVSLLWDEPSPEPELRRARQLKSQTGGLAKCSQCGTDVKIHVSPKRNPHSGKLGRVVSLKDHDLCRRCWRQIIRGCREDFVGDDYLGESQERREVA